MSEILKLSIDKLNEGAISSVREPVELTMPLNGMIYEPFRFNSYGVVEGKTIRKSISAFQNLQNLGAISDSISIGSGFISDPKTSASFIELNGRSDPANYVRVRIPDKLPEFVNNVNIITGSCLFDAGSAKVMLADGSTRSLVNPGDTIDNKVVDIIIDSAPTVYETDTILRLSKAIRDIVSVNNSTSVKLHVPRIEYYAYILDAFYQGNLTVAQVFDWFSAVDDRSHRQFAMFRKRLESNHLNVNRVSPLDVLEDYIKNTVKERRSIKMKDVYDLLYQSDPFFGSVLKFRKPENLSDLNHLGYQIEMLRSDVEQNNRLTLAIDNPSEEPILVQAVRLGRDLNFWYGAAVPALAGLYVLSSTMINTESCDQKARHLYFINKPMTLKTAKEIIRLYKR